MKNYIYKTLFSLSLIATFFSCDSIGDPDAGGTSTENMAGDWYVQMYTKGEEPSGAYALITTYNTSKNDGKEMWIDDHLHLWYFKVKSPVDVSSLTFSGADLPSSVDDDDDASTPPYEITVTITNGQISLNDTETSGGNISNGISFDIEFSDDPGNVYTVSGYKYIGFPEDQH